ncbi:MAG TPA: ABC transporter substrate-binding protein [Candidatus Atribacteria bacterium]|nr:ABC transporter substrate-binding protein [Candidatus Atribacteria bacterium]
MKKVVLTCFLVLVLVLGGVAVGQQAQIPREEALYVAGFQWGPPTSDNPFSGTPMTFISNPRQHIWVYEPLFTYDGLLTGEFIPILGESYQWRDDLTLEIKLNPNAYFHDGEKVTADDVVYSYKLGEKYPIGYSSVWEWLEDVSKEDDQTVVFKMKADNPNRLMVEDALGAVYILPEHIWQKVEEDAGYDIAEIRKFTNENPVGSGPYRVYHESPETIILERVDDYWGVVLHDGELPRPKYVVHPIFKSNDEGNLAFENGEVDLSQQFMPRIWECWENKGLPIGTWYKEVPYHIPATMPSLWFNVNKYPLSLPELRRAIAYCIDYAKIAELAMSNYSPEAKASLIVPYGAQEKYFNEELVKEEGWEYNPEKAVEILEGELGAEKGSDGIYVLPDGTRLGPFEAECPYGWTDWNAALEILAQSAKAVGIDIETSFPDSPVAYDNRQTGNFDMTMWTPSEPSPAQPWLNFQIVLYSKGVPEYGKIAYRNFGRYKNERADELIDLIPTVTDEEELQKLYDELDSLYRQDVPTIPLMYRPWVFYEYNETYWKGFPNADNPYAPGMPGVGAGIEILWHIESVK